jgi:hypothetical protein
MTLSDLASIGSLVSGAAVLGSLIYLALQVRQTDRNQMAAIRHTRVTRIVDIQLAIADPGVAGAWRHGLQSPGEVTQEELTQFVALCRALFYHLEDSFFQHEEGLLNEDAFATVRDGTRNLAGFPGYRTAWKANRRAYAGRFGDFMDGIVASAGRESLTVTPSVDEWRAAYAAETTSG